MRYKTWRVPPPNPTACLRSGGGGGGGEEEEEEGHQRVPAHTRARTHTRAPHTAPETANVGCDQREMKMLGAGNITFNTVQAQAK